MVLKPELFFTLGALSHRLSEQVRLSVFQADPFGPSIPPHGEVDVSADIHRYPILSAKSRQLEVLFSISLANQI